ncbi:MAG TPA: hypothetical protein VJ302_20940 [Blastocatellia bacterium]|nr:hypothetical protein [Blastocatellia bacterium]
MHRYLLGDLPDPEAVLLESELFAEDETFERMWEIENRLVDGYVRDRLSPEDREKFERHYLGSPVHRRRVAVARRLIEKADGLRVEGVETEPHVSWRTRWLGFFSPARQRFAMAAAILLLAISTLWLWRDRTRLQNELAQSRAQVARLTAAPERNERPTPEVAHVQPEVLPPPKVLPPPSPSPAGAPTPERVASSKVFSFALSPMLSRSGGDPNVLTLPPETGVVELRMRAESDGSRRFRVQVRTVEGRPVWTQPNLKARLNPVDPAFIIVPIPAAQLEPGDYILTLSAIDSTGKAEELNRYFFRIVASNQDRER